MESFSEEQKNCAELVLSGHSIAILGQICVKYRHASTQVHMEGLNYKHSLHEIAVFMDKLELYGKV